MKKKVIALGNRVMGDDAIGIKVTEFLKNWISERGFETIIGETDIDHCISQIEDNDYLIIIDAAYFNEEPGKINVFSISELSHQHKKGYSQHEMNLLQLLNIQRKKVTGYCICIEIECIEFSCELSNTLKGKFLEISEGVKKEIQNILEVLSYA